MDKKIKRFVPVKVYHEITKLNYKNKEHLYIICDMIIRVGMFRKKEIKGNNFVEIPKYYFRDIISDSKSLGKAINILKQNKMVICNNYYSKIQGKSLGYKFPNELISKVKLVYVTKKTLTKKIIKNRNDRNKQITEKLERYKNHFMKTFKIDFKKALKKLDSDYDYEMERNSNLPLKQQIFKNISTNNKYNYNRLSLQAIADGELFFNKNKTNGRVDTNLTSLKGTYKQFILSENPLYYIDIKNSQPFILYLYLKLKYNHAEIDMYGEWVKNGRFYENFQIKHFNLSGKTMNREQIKNLMFCIFYSKNTSFLKEKSMFKKVFPKIYEIIKTEKGSKHNQFAIKMQTIESSICIDCICQALDIEDINYYTVHDAWIIEKENVERTMEVINECFCEKYSTKPTLDVERV